jgi:hypothetical protein
MQNPFDEISQKLDTLLIRISDLEKSRSNPPRKILLSEFCRDQNISRPTAYAWAEKGLIKMEKVGGRNFVPSESIAYKKYQRKEIA